MDRQNDPPFRHDRGQGNKANETLEEAVGKLLWEKKRRIAVAESCTGGRIAARMTRVPGSSRYFDAACVVYSNHSKKEFLGVPNDLLIERGAVSPEVAMAMAEGIQKRTGADLGLGVTGIAGPEGGTPEKPVGLVYIGFSDGKEATVERHLFQGDREAVQAQATEKALERIKSYFRESE